MSEHAGTFPLFYAPGLEKFLVWMRTRPDVVKKTLEFFKRRCEVLAKAKLDVGVDALIDVDDMADSRGPFFSPKMFDEFVFPLIKVFARMVHGKGGVYIKHLDGNISPLLHRLAQADIDGLHSIEPSAGMDIGEIKQAYGDQFCLLGNIDVSYTLVNGTKDEIQAETIECIRKASPGGGHILTSSNQIHAGVSYENILTMMDTARKFGSYPLNLPV
jgi:uroporphyrinogen decarboxylase